MKKWILALLPALLLTGCVPKVPTNSETTPDTVSVETEQETAQTESFIITLYPDAAPISCENFENLVEEGFYDGLTFHRVVQDFMAQGGDPTLQGKEKSAAIKGEFKANGVENTLSHKRGIVSMARTPEYDSATSQFFICYTDDCSSLDGSYAAFGEVTEGMEVVDHFLDVPREVGSDGALSAPTSPIVMEKVEMIEDDEAGNPRAEVTVSIPAD